MHNPCVPRGTYVYPANATFRHGVHLTRLPQHLWQSRKPELSAAAKPAGREPTGDGLLSWSLTEDSTPESDDLEVPAHGSNATVHAPGKAGSQHGAGQNRRRKQQQQQQQHKRAQHNQQQQHGMDLKLSKNGEQQHRHAASDGVEADTLQPPTAAARAAHSRQLRKQQQATYMHLDRIPTYPAARSRNRSLISSPANSDAGCSHGKKGSTAHVVAARDTYREAQQRVRAVLSTADISNPEAAAEQLPNTVNDLTTALQLLATAPRPKNLPAYRQYDAAVHTLAAAVLSKYKRLLLSELVTPQHQPKVRPGQNQEEQLLSAALAALPATKLAATTFSLGVLRLYDAAMVAALEDASLQLMSRGAFKPNQLGQIVQGFVYLDHMLSPHWHEVFLDSTRRHLGDMQGAQLASLAVWLTTYHLFGASSSGSRSSAAVMGGASSAPPLLRPAPLAAAAAVVAMEAVGSAGIHSLKLDPAWVQAYLTAVGRSAASLKTLQLAQVLQATAALCQTQQQHQQLQRAMPDEATNLDVGQDGQAVVEPAALRGIPVAMQGWPAALPSTADAVVSTASSSSTAALQRRGMQLSDHRGSSRQHTSFNSNCTGSSWVLPLAAAFQRQLPELTMAHLAAALPPFLVLTQPWPQEALQPLLLQVKLLLPGSSGKDLIAVVQTAAQLAGAGVLAADVAWCDAVVTQLHAQLPTFGPAELAGAVHTVAVLRVKPYKAWLYALCQRLRVDAKAMDAGQVLMVLDGLAQVGVQLDPEVLHVFVLGIKRWMGSLHLDDIKRIVSALRCMYPKVLPGRTVQQLVEELQRRQQFLALQAQQQAMLMP